MKTYDRVRFTAMLTLLLSAIMVVPAVSMAAEPTVDLKTTAPFAILAHTTITNTGPTTITGDVGLHDGSAFVSTGVTLNGTAHITDAVALLAMNDLVDVYNDAAGRTITATTLTELGGLTLGPGVYSSGGVYSITGTLTLDARGDRDAVFIFKSASSLTAAGSSTVRLINGARFCRVFWVVPSDATINTYATFVGHVFAMSSIWVRTGATVEGQLLARTGEVTLDTNVITNDICLTERPLRIAKTASPAALPAGPGWVTYEYRVSNLGIAPVSAVVVTDDKLGVLTRTSGDTNLDNILQNTETWIYTKLAYLTATTTNVAVAAGTVNQAPASGSSAVTVAVAGRLLPNTATPWYTVLLAGVVLTLLGAAGYWMTTRKIHA